jgi:hypothetical protein
MKEGVVSAAPPLTVSVVWSFLGYHFPAGSMIVGLLACLMVRLFITLDAPCPKRWLLDGIVTGLALLVTAVWIKEHQVDLFATWHGRHGRGGWRRDHQLLQAARPECDRRAGVALPGKPAVPADMIATLREVDKHGG